MRLNEILYDRDQAAFLTNIVHDEWLETIIAGHEESYEQWSSFAAWLILKCVIPEQNRGTVC